jgi:hypothetical protein
VRVLHQSALPPVERTYQLLLPAGGSRTLGNHFMRRFYFVALFALIGTFLLGCSCERANDKNGDNKGPTEDLSQPPPPLTLKPVPPELKVDVFPQVGATDARPIAIVVAQDGTFCTTVREEWKAMGHVLCIDQPLELAEPRLRRAVAFLKEAYPRHTGKPPVHLFADRSRSEVGWRLMLKEPGFFSYGFLPGLEESALTNTTLSALHSRGARALALGASDSNRLEFLKNVAARRGLQVYPLGPQAGALRQAIALLRSRDARFMKSELPKANEATNPRDVP